MEVIPNDLVRKCLLRVPYKSHNMLKAVCRNWEDIVKCPRFYADRKICGTSEQLLCLIQRDRIQRDMNGFFVITVYDPVTSTWEKLPRTDHNVSNSKRAPVWSQCVAVNRKLVVVSGLYHHPSFSNTYPVTIRIYDFESATWRAGSTLHTRRQIFPGSLSSSTGLVYIASGMDDYDRFKTPLVYNVEEDRWENLPPMTRRHGLGCHGVFIEDKFMVLCEGGRSVEIFDPRARTWSRREDMWRFGGSIRNSSVVASSSGELYAFTKEEVMKYDGEKNDWGVVAPLPQPFGNFICATPWRDWIFVSTIAVIGKHLSYLFHPPTGQWIEVNGGGREEFEGMIVSAATVEI